MSIKIRPLIIDDIEVLVSMEKELLFETIGKEMMIDAITKDYAHFIVSEVDKKTVGYIGVWIFNEKAEIINFVVQKEYQHCGIGQMLFAKIIKICQINDVKEITLEVRDTNNQAQKFYELQGFKPVHIREKYYHDGSNAIVMQRRIK